VILVSVIVGLLCSVVCARHCRDLRHSYGHPLRYAKTTQALKAWTEARSIHIQLIQPSKPQQNAYIERYNRTLHHEWLDQNIYETIEEAQDQAAKWFWTYNNDRPNIAIGKITPAMKLKMVA
jgi:putative transposase